MTTKASAQHVHATVVASSESLSATACALSLVCDPFPQRCESNEIDGHLLGLDTEQRRKILTNTIRAVFQLSERQRTMALKIRPSIQRRDDTSIDER
jgi:hypothetical protein